jgi:hypothetical protein
MKLTVRVPPSRIEERRYVLDVVLREWLGIDYELVSAGGDSVVISRSDAADSPTLTIADALFPMSADDWLTTQSMPTLPLVRVRGVVAGSPLANGPIPVLFGTANLDGDAWARTDAGLETSVDLLGGIFFMLTRYEELVRRERDSHGRFPYDASLAFAEGFVERPIVDEYVDMLWWGLSSLWSSLERKRSAYRLRLTHDVDYAWAAVGRPPTAVARSLLGDLVRRRDPGIAASRLRAIIDVGAGRVDRDPYNTFDFLMTQSESHGTRSTFYFQARPSGRYGSQYRLTDPQIQGLMRTIHERGHEIGLHPSYESHGSLERTIQEFDDLRAACDLAGVAQASWGVRQHYLRFEAPTTWRILDRAGFAHDSTVGYAERIGFRAGTCREFPVFDLLTSRSLRIRERPLLVMDATLLTYMSLGLDEAVSRAGAIADACRLHEGDATILYHNHTLHTRRLRDHYRTLLQRVVSSRPRAS